jgi:hypothetical protein
MTKLFFILSFYFIISFTFGQSNGCDDCDTSYRKKAGFVKKDYAQFQKNSCDAKIYSDAKDAKELLCRAKYYLSINNNLNSIECLKQAYIKGSSAEFKFQILKLMDDNYKQLGDSKQAEVYQEKVNRVIERFPNIEK